MKKQFPSRLLLGVTIAGIVLLSAFDGPRPSAIRAHGRPLTSTDELKTEAYDILDNKCNTCHRKKNPFMIFSPKNMEKRASKIFMAVFVNRRMPKPEGAPLTDEESRLLFDWLQTQKLK